MTKAENGTEMQRQLRPSKVNDMGALPFDVMQLHTTPLGEERIRRNLHKEGREVDVVKLMREMILDDSATAVRKGKNWYITSGDCRITVNASSLTIITAHRLK